MVLTKIPGGLIEDGSITSADITDSTITNAKMALDPANASNLNSGDVPLAQLDNVPPPNLSPALEDIALLAFKTQANGNLSRYNLVDQSVDAFEDATGISAGDWSTKLYRAKFPFACVLKARMAMSLFRGFKSTVGTFPS